MPRLVEALAPAARSRRTRPRCAQRDGLADGARAPRDARRGGPRGGHGGGAARRVKIRVSPRRCASSRGRSSRCWPAPGGSSYVNRPSVGRGRARPGRRACSLLARGAAAAALARTGSGMACRGEPGARRRSTCRTSRSGSATARAGLEQPAGRAGAAGGRARSSQAGTIVAITPDGPRGPRRDLKPGRSSRPSAPGCRSCPSTPTPDAGLAATFLGPVRHPQAVCAGPGGLRRADPRWGPDEGVSEAAGACRARHARCLERMHDRPAGGAIPTG